MSIIWSFLDFGMVGYRNRPDYNAKIEKESIMYNLFNINNTVVF
jgi:hypothetical protein